jgi:hypothetical protein
MRNGVTVWVNPEGFYAYDGTEVTFLFQDQRDEAKKFNRARLHRAVACFDQHSGEYRCWLAYDGSVANSMCFAYDGTAWRQRNDIDASDVCVTDDHRSLVIASGVAETKDGVWVLDRAGPNLVGQVRTGWFRSDRSSENASVRRVLLLLRETAVVAETNVAAKITVSWAVDYRYETKGTVTVFPYPRVDPRYGVVPDAFGTAVLGAAVLRTRRPFWTRADIKVDSAEVFRLDITCTGRFEILAISFEEQPRETGSTQKPR